MNKELFVSALMLLLVAVIQYFKQDQRVMIGSIGMACSMFIWSFFSRGCERCPKCKSCLTNNNIWKLENYGRCRCSDCDVLISSDE